MSATPPAASLPPEPPPPSGSSDGSGGGLTISRNALIAIVIVAALLIGAAAGALLLSSSEDASASTVDLEPISTSGDNPFMASVGTDEAEVTPPPETAGTFSGNTPGLYGGTQNRASCDPAQMIAYLEQNPSKAAAWAGVLRINIRDIRQYVGELTPVILRTDTAVTNHGFANGRATMISAILQAGTAVMVDKYGIPRVKCYCGNPLTPPQVYTKPTYSGPRWTGFRPNGITVIQQSTVIIDIFVLVDPKTGTTFDRPTGTNGAEDVITINDIFPDPTVPATTPPTSPATSPPTAPLPQFTEQDAFALIDQRRGQCAGVVFPFEPHASEDYSATPSGPPGVYTVTITGHTEGGGTQIFSWLVDVPNGTLTPSNGLAQTAVQYCGALSG